MVRFVVDNLKKCVMPINSSPELGELTLEARVEGKLACIIPCKEEEDEVKVTERGRGLLIFNS
jgi:hypothetical protein